MTGKLLGDEKLKGTIHLAFGNNCSMGGDNNVPVHIDALVLAPDVEFDGIPVIRRGTWLLD
jgi:leucyl aminopeptidase (aminopeptidase T)